MSSSVWQSAPCVVSCCLSVALHSVHDMLPSDKYLSGKYLKKKVSRATVYLDNKKGKQRTFK